MTLLAPWILVAAGTVALGVVALHLLALQRPPAAPFPTARFVPDAPARAASRALRPTDRWLLLLRVLAVLLLGAAFARPVMEPARAPVRQVVVVDRGRAVASAGELRDSVAALVRPGDAVVLLDSVARTVSFAAPESLAAALAAPVATRTSLSAGLLAAQRLAAALADSTDSVRVVVVSPLAEESLDAATAAVRGEWPGAVRVVRVSARAPDAGAVPALDVAHIDVTDPGDDALALAARLAGLARPDAAVRLRRTAPGAADSAWARAGGGVLLVWPADGAVPVGWTPRETPDTVSALAAGGAVLVATLARHAVPPADSLHVARLWWSDGLPAAVEAPLGAGCVRTVGVGLPEAGDLVLRASFHRLLAELAVPCGGAIAPAPAADSALGWLRGNGAATVAVARTGARPAPLVPWLLAAGLLLLLVEPLLRRARSA